MGFDDSMGFGKVVASSVEGEHSFTLYNVAGISALDFTTDDTDEGGEKGLGEENYQSLGIVGRPLPPDGDDALETIFARTGDGLVPFGYRDARLNRNYPNPAEGDVAFVSYGGGFHSMSLNASGETIHTLYCPYNRNSEGVPQKAHTVTLDPEQGISVVHADGHAVLLTAQGNVVIKNASGDAYVQVGSSGITLNGNLVLNGGATIGDPVGALPATIATPLISYLGALEVLLGTLATTIDAKLAVTTTAVPAVASFVAAGAALKAAMPATKASVA